MPSIRIILVLSLVGLQLVAVLIVMALSWFASETALIGHARALMADVARQTIVHAEGFLQPADRAADLSRRLAAQDVVQTENEGALTRYFFELLRSNAQFAGIFFGGDDGRFIYVSRDASRPGAEFRVKTIQTEGGRAVRLSWRDALFAEVAAADDPADAFDPRTRPWYERASASGDVAWTDPYIFFSSRRPGLTVATPVRAPGGAQTGVVGIDIEIDALSAFLASLAVSENGRAFVLARNGDVLAHPMPDKIRTIEGQGTRQALRFTRADEIDDPVVRAAWRSLDGALGSITFADPRETRFSVDGTDYLAVFSAMPGERWPWIVASLVPEDDFLGAIKESQTFNALAALAIALLTCAIGLAVARSLTRPIGALYERANRLADGHLEASPLPPMHYKELHRTGEAFERLGAWLRRYQSDNATLTGELVAAQKVLEDRVAARTSELAATNARLTREIGERRHTEEQLEEQASDLADANTQAALLTNELNHRVKNLFQVVASIVSLSARESTDAATVATRARQRIEALSRAHMLTQGRGRGAEIHLERMVESVLAPYAALPGITIRREGEPVQLRPDVVTPLGLILHELATNASKYGALGHEGGIVTVAWRIVGGEAVAESGTSQPAPAGEPYLEISWREDSGDGTAVPPPTREGFGATVLDGMIVQLRGRIDREWRAEGLFATIRVPASRTIVVHPPLKKAV